MAKTTKKAPKKTDRIEIGKLPIQGLVSYPKLTMPEALAANLTSQYQVADEQVKTGLGLIITKGQYDTLVEHIKAQLPLFVQMYEDSDGERGLDPDLLDAMIEALDKETWRKPKLATVATPFRSISETTEELLGADAGDYHCVASIKSFKAGVDMYQCAIAESPEDLAEHVASEAYPATWPSVQNIESTRFAVDGIYPGSTAIVQVQPWVYSGQKTGINLSANAVILSKQTPSFVTNGAADYDEDAVLAMVAQ